MWLQLVVKGERPHEQCQGSVLTYWLNLVNLRIVFRVKSWKCLYTLFAKHLQTVYFYRDVLIQILASEIPQILLKISHWTSASTPIYRSDTTSLMSISFTQIKLQFSFTGNHFFPAAPKQQLCFTATDKFCILNGKEVICGSVAFDRATAKKSVIWQYFTLESPISKTSQFCGIH